MAEGGPGGGKNRGGRSVDNGILFPRRNAVDDLFHLEPITHGRAKKIISVGGGKAVRAAAVFDNVRIGQRNPPACSSSAASEGHTSQRGYSQDTEPRNENNVQLERGPRTWRAKTSKGQPGTGCAGNQPHHFQDRNKNLGGDRSQNRQNGEAWHQSSQNAGFNRGDLSKRRGNYGLQNDFSDDQRDNRRGGRNQDFNRNGYNPNSRGDNEDFSNGRDNCRGERSGAHNRSGYNPNSRGDHFSNERDNCRGKGSGVNNRRVNNEDHQGNNHKGDNSNDRNRNHMLSYKRLEDLLKQDATDVLTVLANTQNGYLDLIAGELRPDLMVLVIRVLAKACNADFVSNKANLLASVCTNSSKFLKKLSSHVNAIFTDSNHKRRQGMEMFFEDCLHVCATIIDLLPNTACECLILPLGSIDVALTNATDMLGMTFDAKLLRKPKELKIQLKVKIEDQKVKVVKVSRRNELLAYEQPPDNFRDLSIFPTPTDILTHDEAFVRPNIVEGAYQDVDHYLDVQFRLLREDFVQPLREGITDYITMTRDGVKKKINNIRIYKNTIFEKVEVLRDCMGYVIKFQYKGKMKWEYSKRFMFGSLLCFTKDDFKTIMFATVLDRDVKKLEQGLIAVKMESGMEAGDDLFNTPFIMVESEVYFEPYYHVLKALQNMNPETFPMSPYIVQVQGYSHYPFYIEDHPHYCFKINGYRVKLLVERTWPSAARLDMDESQYQAFKLALTNEFVVIQGPPGTGKTYLALKIAKTLLANVRELLSGPDAGLRIDRGAQPANDKEKDDNDPIGTNEHTPILVVCFTNHALDQFLEGLLEQTEQIIRVGGQSKSEALEQYNLKEQRRNHKRKGTTIRLSRDIRQRMSILMERIKGIQVDMEHLNSRSGVVSIDSIASVFKHTNIDCLKGENGKLSNDTLLEWLFDPNQQFDDDLPASNQLPNSSQEEKILEVVGKDLEDNQGDEIWQRAPVDEFGLDENLVAKVKVDYAFLFKDREDRLDQIQTQLAELMGKPAPGEYILHDKAWELEDEYTNISNSLRNFKHGIKHAKSMDRLFWQKLINQQVNLWELNHEQRWSVYRHLVTLLHTSLEQELHLIELRYKEEAKQFEEVKQIEDLEIMKKADIVGMTTTGAARLQPLLQALKCRIVIVEEAAEVMESHIIVSLTHHCQHLILIGDHKQLRPTTAVYKLARDFNFDISLFERMVKNGVHCQQLSVQHRMRPEIAKLIVPSIYKTLDNHSSVFEYKKIKGVTKSLFFLTHNHPELEVSETNSKSNPFEADTLLRLCRYLLLQGYSASQITILTTYSGQMYYLRSERRRFPSLANVQMTIVDNFQGEENDIILLSLVRNNKKNNVGFLKTENRVCVALSRAKHGMFIMGNMDNLTFSVKVNTNQVQVWPEIKKALVAQDALGEHLVLRCQIHPDQTTRVQCADDFNQVPEGGCRLPCDALLNCGHRCKSLCHASDREHEEYKCNEICTRIPPNCDYEHPCPKLCSADCGDCEVSLRYQLRCGHTKSLPCHADVKTYKCVIQEKVTRATCGHTFDKPCHFDMDTFPCPCPCDNRLGCGHSCTLKCHLKDDPDHITYKCKMQCAKTNAGCKKDHVCQRKCYEECKDCLVEVKMRPANCNHMFKMPCSTDPATIVCTKPCKRMMACGHECKKECNQPCTGCSVKVSKNVVECGHSVLIMCCETADISRCNGPCTRLLSCGHRCMRSCKMTCSTIGDCVEMVRSKVTPVCGHAIQVPCNMQAKGLAPDASELLAHCQEKCLSSLECEHKCSGTCGSCLQGRIHEGCKSKCGRFLICGHKCTYPCAKECPPCKQKCETICTHSKCNKQCGVPCVTCKMKCPWQCEHHACTKQCGEVCNRPPCYEACPKKLPCKHPCIGFCGEPCPPLCRVCNMEQVTETFFGDEDEPGARFVYLVDCKHTLLSEGVERWLQMKQTEIILPTCPYCKRNIMKTLRFMNQVKGVLSDVRLVKKKAFGDEKANEVKRIRLLKKLSGAAALSCTSVNAKALYNKLMGKLQPITGKNRINFLSLVDLDTISAQISIFTEVLEVFTNARQKVNSNTLTTLIQYSSLLLDAVTQRDMMSAQEIADFNMELRRFQQIAHYFELVSRMSVLPPSQRVKNLYELVHGVVLCKKRYTNDDYDRMTRYIHEWSVAMNVVPLTKKERDVIVKAMGMSVGHWFKCPNGHIYAITECGGAMQESICPECRERIGGSSHRLLNTNAVATEMDGAILGAYDASVQGLHAFLNHR